MPATTYPASPKQVAFIATLRAERGLAALTADEAAALSGGRDGDASRMISHLLTLPKARAARPAGVTTPGVFRYEGQVYVVKPSRQDRSRLYAKRVVELRDAQGDRLAEDGDRVRIELEYAPGVVRRLTEAHRLSVEEGKALTVRYGRCLCCGRKLRVAESVERGIGPVCIRYFRG